MGDLTITGHAEVRRLLADDRLGRSHPDPGTAAGTGESALFGGPLGNFDTEQTDRAWTRSLLQPHFSPKHMRALHPSVVAVVTQLLDERAAKAPPVDLQTALALAPSHPGDLRAAGRSV